MTQADLQYLLARAIFGWPAPQRWQPAGTEWSPVTRRVLFNTFAIERNTRVKLNMNRNFRNLSVFSLAAVTALSLPASRAAAQIEGADIIYRYDQPTNKIVAGPQEPGTPLADLFSREIGLPFPGASDYENDTGMDVFPGFDADYTGPNGESFQFSRVTVQELSIAPGLSAFYQFDGVTPVFGALSDPAYIHYWELTANPITDPNDPFYKALKQRGATQISAGASSNGVSNYFHQHFIFNAANPGEYDFTYKLTDAFLLDGTQVPDSGPFTIHYFTAPAVVPEPGAVALLAVSGLSALGLLRRRK